MAEPSAEAGVARLNELDQELLVDELERLSGCPGWAHSVMLQRPFADAAALFTAADSAWAALARQDWLDAFEVYGTEVPPDADQATAGAAHVALRLYRERFGHAFVAAAPSRAADELLMRVRIRLGNDEETEWRVACDEQRRATRARLSALVERA